jgi:hypothetical protein
MRVLNKILRFIRISIFVLHTLWVAKSVVSIFRFEMLKQTIFIYVLLTGLFFASFILFSMLYEKTIPSGKKNDIVLGRFVSMFKVMVTTSALLVLTIIIKSIFFS